MPHTPPHPPPDGAPDPPLTDPELAAFQAAFLEALDRHTHAADVLAALRADPAAAPYRDWLARLDPAMLEVAASLVSTWGVRRSALHARAADPAADELREHG